MYLGLPLCVLVWDLPLEHGQSLSDHTTKEESIPLLLQLSTGNSPQIYWWRPSSMDAGILDGLALYRSCARNQRC